LNSISYNLKEIKLELTYKCALRCVHCSSNGYMSSDCEMPYSVAVSILNQAIQMHVEQISFSGGEPLRWPGIHRIADICSSANINAQVYTSGYIGDYGVFDSIRHGISTVIFSIYSAISDVHENVTAIKGSYSRTLSAIAKAKESGINVELHFVPLGINYDHLDNVIQFAKAMGISTISVLRFVPHGRGRDNPQIALNKEQNTILYNMINKNRSTINLRTGSPYNFLMINANPECNAGIDRLTITPDMHIYPCDAFKQVKAINIVGTDEYSRLDKWTLDECWKSSHYLNMIRKYHLLPPDGSCNKCSCYNKCLGGCIAQKYIAYGYMTKGPDPMCLC
jgi:radical SAM protein with 4Fe4S-binding SPASM domain